MFANALFKRIPDNILATRWRHKFRACLAFSLVLSGCVTERSVELPDLSDASTRYAVLAQLDEWEFAGRIGVSAGSEGFNGKLWWRQYGPVYRARISGPLGVGTVFINGNRGEMTVTDNDGVAVRMDDAEVELRQRYGWTIPVESLRYWALGARDPNLPSTGLPDDLGRVSQFAQGSWSVHISEYREAAGQQMPRRLTAVSGDVKIRLIIDEWTFFN